MILDIFDKESLTYNFEGEKSVWHSLQKAIASELIQQLIICIYNSKGS